MSKFTVFVALWLVVGACAEAGPQYGPPDDGPDAAVDGPDARPFEQTPDATTPPPRIDAATPPPTIDAAPPPPPPPPPPIDAGSGLFCSSNADCPAADDCCFIALCVPVLEIGDLCFPSE